MPDTESPNHNDESGSSVVLQLLLKGDQQKLSLLNFLSPDELNGIGANVKAKILNELIKFANMYAYQAMAYQKDRQSFEAYIRYLEFQTYAKMDELEVTTARCYKERENLDAYIIECNELRSQLVKAQSKISRLGQKLTEVQKQVQEVTQEKEDSLENVKKLQAEIDKLTENLQSHPQTVVPDDVDVVSEIKKVDASTATTRAESWPNYFKNKKFSDRKNNSYGADGNVNFIESPKKNKKKLFNHTWCHYG